MVSAVCLSLLAAPAVAFVPTPFVAEQVRHAPAARSATSAHTTTRMVATPEKVTTGVKRNENFAKLKVFWLSRCLDCIRVRVCVLLLSTLCLVESAPACSGVFSL